MTDDAIIKSDIPMDRLTRLCDAMTDGLVEHSEYDEDVKAVVMLLDAERGGIQLHGYDDDTEAMADILTHLRALFQANGKDLSVVTLPGKGQG